MDSNNIKIKMKNINEKSEYRNELREIEGKTQVPCLVIEGTALYESNDIIQWFKDNYLSK
jgi:glutaredoxin